MKHIRSLLVPCAMLLALCAPAGAQKSEELVKANQNAGEWMLYGRTYDNQRFSPLTQISPKNVASLRPVWAAALSSLDGVEATPLVKDGVLYVSGAYSHVFAFDARNGQRLWHWAPEYAPELGTILCC